MKYIVTISIGHEMVCARNGIEDDARELMAHLADYLDCGAALPGCQAA